MAVFIQLEIEDITPGSIMDGETPFFWLLPVKTKLYNSYLTFPRQTLMKVFNFPVKNTSSGIGTFKAASIAALAAAAVFV